MKKEGLIKSVSEGNKTLEHNRYRNIMGFLVDSFNAVFDVGGYGGAVQKQIFNIKDAKSILDQKN